MFVHLLCCARGSVVVAWCSLVWLIGVAYWCSLLVLLGVAWCSLLVWLGVAILLCSLVYSFPALLQLRAV